MTSCGPVSSSGRTLLREVVEFLSSTLFSLAYFCILQVLSKAGLKSRDMNFSFPVLLRHIKENFGVRRRSNALSLTLFGAFCRSGSAMIAAMAFIVIIKSYSFLPIPALDLLSIGLRTFFISFLLARHPGNGAYTALAALCMAYGRFEAGYLILKPLAFYLVAVGTFLDVMISSLGSYAVARLSGFIEEKNVVHFI